MGIYLDSLLPVKLSKHEKLFCNDFIIKYDAQPKLAKGMLTSEWPCYDHYPTPKNFAWRLSSYVAWCSSHGTIAATAIAMKTFAHLRCQNPAQPLLPATSRIHSLTYIPSQQLCQLQTSFITLGLDKYISVGTGPKVKLFYHRLFLDQMYYKHHMVELHAN